MRSRRETITFQHPFRIETPSIAISSQLSLPISPGSLS
jgi:hypothetical protein